MPELSMADQPPGRKACIPIAGVQLRLRRAGKGPPLLVLHHDIGTLGAAARSTTRSPQRFDAAAALAPRLRPVGAPGLDAHRARPRGDLPAACWRSSACPRGRCWASASAAGSRPRWPRMAPRGSARLMLVGADGDQAAPTATSSTRRWSATSTTSRAGFDDQAAFERLYGADPSTDQLEQWDLNREMTFRIAWKPYMYSPTLPHLLGGVRTPTLVVWGRRGPRRAARVRRSATRQALPKARLEVVAGCGHCVEMEQPAELVAPRHRPSPQRG